MQGCVKGCIETAQTCRCMRTCTFQRCRTLSAHKGLQDTAQCPCFKQEQFLDADSYLEITCCCIF